jgi:Fur family transcriptional regulator, peroxide stress response regulator
LSGRNQSPYFLDPYHFRPYSAGMPEISKHEPAVQPGDSSKIVRSALEAAGCRYTQQRAAVFSYLEKVTSHPTADEVYHAVRRSVPRISLATVYKSLEVLVLAGLATKLTNGDDSARYDCRGEDHYHLRDIATGEMRDLPVPFDPQLLTKLDPKLVERLKSQGFQVTGYRLEVLGEFKTSESCR